MAKMPTEQVHKKYIDYINNTNNFPLKIEHFDDDWDPVGPMVRKNMVRDDLIQERQGYIYLRPDLVRYR